MKNEITIQGILNKANQQTKQFIKDLGGEEDIERVERIDVVQNDIKAVRQDVERKKSVFINELKSGLGDKVKQNPNKITVIKKPFGQKVKEFFKNIFTKF